MKLLLFDIDGTLLRTRAGRIAMETAMEEVFDVKDGLEGVQMQGCTDCGILERALEVHSIPLPADLAPFWAVNLRILETLLADGQAVHMLPGVSKLLDAALREGAHLGLVTGNARGTAQAKLARLALWSQFPVGAFGCEDPIRWKLVALARRRAKKHFGVEHAGSDVVVIGDTHRDIRAAREAGVLVCAVATGHCNLEALARDEPDLLLKDFKDTGTLERLLGLGARA